jgi:hypothetical protein
MGNRLAIIAARSLHYADVVVCRTVSSNLLRHVSSLPPANQQTSVFWETVIAGVERCGAKEPDVHT